MTASFVSFGWFAALSVLDFCLSPIRKVFCGWSLSYSAPLYMYASLVAIFISCAWDEEVFLAMYNGFYSAPPYLGMNINNATWPSGAYVAAGTPSVITLLKSQIVPHLFLSWVAAWAWSTLQLLLFHRQFLLSTAWCNTNSFLTHVSPPTFITALPLEQSNAIKIGNRTFCKPSTMALMGYASVLEVSNKVDTSKQENHDLAIVSIYALIPALFAPLWWPWRPRLVGKITSNMFLAKRHQLNSKKQFTYSRGTCIS
ncbi:hypothetical protein ACHHYP_00006 [Achlya hypogyna]|uniref:Uncharacterized protein n=1 Tax=Achlya hypogyna TaxID=1202772 RepID=A0A1V9ZD60_ACHHY|nr:hypothetical protein ACHHYP_00006 [Achlya hypogyna]